MRTPRRRWLWVLAAVGVVQMTGRLLVHGWPEQAGDGVSPRSRVERVVVVRAVDGDTIRVRHLEMATEPPSATRRPGGSGRAAASEPIASTVAPEGREDVVRVIGVDAPELHRPRTPVQCYGQEAASYAARELVGRQVVLERDASDRDRYGRLLAYIWLSDPDVDEDAVRTGMFNARLLVHGYAQVLTVPPDVRYAPLFGRLEQEARADGRGLWGACPR